MSQKRAYAYIRVSGKGQVAGDGFTRQEQAIKKYAKEKGYKIVNIFREKGVSGSEIERPALADLQYSLEKNGYGIQTVLIEKTDRLARMLMIQEIILADFKKKGIDVISACEGDLSEEDPYRKVMRQIMAAIAEYDKAMIIEKLRVSRNRKKALTGKCEGRKAYNERKPEVIKEVKRLRRKPRNGKRLSLERTVEALHDSGFTTATGKQFTISRLKNLIYQSQSF